MPLYFFDVLKDAAFMLDDHGLELTDNHAAEREAIAASIEMMRDIVFRDQADRIELRVRGLMDQVIATVRLSLVVERSWSGPLRT